MTNKYIDHIIAREANRLRNQHDPFIRNGCMGLCLFLFNMYELTANIKYYNLAQNFLRIACSSIKRNSKVNITDGLSGIGLGIIYLYKKGYFTGNLYEILKSIDEEIYKNVIKSIDYDYNFSINGHEEALMDVALYMIERVIECNIPKSEERILKLFINHLINKLYQGHDYIFYLEPIPYSLSYKLARFVFLLSKAYLIDTCKSRVLHIWEESRRTILAQSPYLSSNKVLLLCALVELRKRISTDKRLNDLIVVFKNDISISQIIKNEIPANSMSMLVGLPGISRLLLKLNFSLTEAELKLLSDRMKSSLYYNMRYSDIIDNNFTGLNGILGYISAYLNIKKYYE